MHGQGKHVLKRQMQIYIVTFVTIIHSNIPCPIDFKLNQIKNVYLDNILQMKAGKGNLVT